MPIKSLRLGPIDNYLQWYSEDFDSAFETDVPIKAGSPVDNNDVVRLQDLQGSILTPVSVADIDNPTELNSLSGVVGALLLVYETVGLLGTDKYTIYVYDSSGPSVNSPYVVDADGITANRWIAIGGKYTNNNVYWNGNLLKPNVDLDIDCGNNGVDTNYTLRLVQPVWDDIRVVPGSFDRPGASDPSYVLYYPNGGAIGTYSLEFAKDNIASFTIQLPHKYKQGTDIRVHVHWNPGAYGAAQNGNFVGWKVDWTWANKNGAFGDMQTADLSDACDGTNHKHQITPDVVLDGHTNAKNISSMLLCNIRRTDTGADDTWSETVSGRLPMLLEVDFHFQIDTQGSRQIGIK